MCAGGHGLRAKHPVGLWIAKQQGQTQLLRADAGQAVPSLYTPHPPISFGMLRLSVLQSHFG